MKEVNNLLKANTKYFLERIDEYEKRWLRIIEGLQDKSIDYDNFYRIIKAFYHETKTLSEMIMDFNKTLSSDEKSILLLKTFDSFWKIDTQMIATYAVTMTKWKNEHPSVLDRFLNIIEKKGWPDIPNILEQLK